MDSRSMTAIPLGTEQANGYVATALQLTDYRLRELKVSLNMSYKSILQQTQFKVEMDNVKVGA